MTGGGGRRGTSHRLANRERQHEVHRPLGVRRVTVHGGLQDGWYPWWVQGGFEVAGVTV